MIDAVLANLNQLRKEFAFEKRPKEPEALLFSCVLSAAAWGPVSQVLRWSDAFLRTISPAVPVELRTSTPTLPPRHRGLAVFFGTMFFCFFLTGALCLLEGRFFSAEPPLLNFLDDRWNIFLYVVICPGYVTLAVSIIVLTVEHWSRLNDFANRYAEQPAVQAPGRRLMVAALAIFLITTLGITTYIYDGLSSPGIKLQYWFCDVVNGVRTLNRVGCYYIGLNFGLLLITTTAVFCFFSVALETMSIGRNLERSKPATFAELEETVGSFIRIYHRMKWLVMLYMLNAYVWKYSPIGRADVYANFNLFVSGAVLTAVGLIFVAVPRLYVEAKWHAYKHKLQEDAKLKGEVPASKITYEDLRDEHTKLWVWLVDLLLLSGFIKGFWDFKGWKLLNVFETDKLLDLLPK